MGTSDGSIQKAGPARPELRDLCSLAVEIEELAEARGYQARVELYHARDQKLSVRITKGAVR